MILPLAERERKWQEYEARQAARVARAQAGLCVNCGKRPGSLTWGDSLAVSHGFAEKRCGVCVYGAQIKHALGRVLLALPGLVVRYVIAVARGR